MSETQKTKFENSKQEKMLETLQNQAVELNRSVGWESLEELAFKMLTIRTLMEGKRGAFKKWWESAGFTQARVSYCLRLANGNHSASTDEQKPRTIALRKLAARGRALYDSKGEPEKIRAAFRELLNEIREFIGDMPLYIDLLKMVYESDAKKPPQSVQHPAKRGRALKRRSREGIAA